ncbi:MAG: CBS domain-containing protein [Kouleothrix sp.]
MTRDIAQVSPDAPVRDIVTLLIDRALRALPVVDAERAWLASLPMAICSRAAQLICRLKSSALPLADARCAGGKPRSTVRTMPT